MARCERRTSSLHRRGHLRVRGLRGEFPGTEIVATFQAEERPGIRFARRWPLYDDLGNQSLLDGADIELMEDIEAAGYGLPPTSRCVPDAEGLVWF